MEMVYNKSLIPFTAFCLSLGPPVCVLAMYYSSPSEKVPELTYHF